MWDGGIEIGTYGNGFEIQCEGSAIGRTRGCLSVWRDPHATLRQAGEQAARYIEDPALLIKDYDAEVQRNVARAAKRAARQREQQERWSA